MVTDWVYHFKQLALLIDSIGVIEIEPITPKLPILYNQSGFTYDNTISN